MAELHRDGQIRIVYEEPSLVRGYVRPIAKATLHLEVDVGVSPSCHLRTPYPVCNGEHPPEHVIQPDEDGNHEEEANDASHLNLGKLALPESRPRR
jgi:hypothetical protein